MSHSNDDAHGDQFTNHGKQHSRSERQSVSFLFTAIHTEDWKSHNLRADGVPPPDTRPTHPKRSCRKTKLEDNPVLTGALSRRTHPEGCSVPGTRTPQVLLEFMRGITSALSQPMPPQRPMWQIIFCGLLDLMNNWRYWLSVMAFVPEGGR